ncbi:MAG: hypothetical protein IKW74_04530 [Thermoguttaceae bacterium]|nr:hypothetical protein [Thermoguttaceae bacterium]
MIFLIGTDEAGYGPNLGPLVVSLSCWQWNPDVPETRISGSPSKENMVDAECVSVHPEKVTRDNPVKGHREKESLIPRLEKKRNSARRWKKTVSDQPTLFDFEEMTGNMFSSGTGNGSETEDIPERFNALLESLCSRQGLFPVLDSKQLYHSSGDIVLLEKTFWLALLLCRGPSNVRDPADFSISDNLMNWTGPRKLNHSEAMSDPACLNYSGLSDSMKPDHSDRWMPFKFADTQNWSFRLLKRNYLYESETVYCEQDFDISLPLGDEVKRRKNNPLKGDSPEDEVPKVKTAKAERAEIYGPRTATWKQWCHLAAEVRKILKLLGISLVNLVSCRVQPERFNQRLNENSMRPDMFSGNKSDLLGEVTLTLVQKELNRLLSDKNQRISDRDCRAGKIAERIPTRITGKPSRKSVKKPLRESEPPGSCFSVDSACSVAGSICSVGVVPEEKSGLQIRKPGSQDKIIILCDKLGGRNQYGSLLNKMLPDYCWRPVVESRSVSIYRACSVGNGSEKGIQLMNDRVNGGFPGTERSTGYSDNMISLSGNDALNDRNVTREKSVNGNDFFCDNPVIEIRFTAKGEKNRPTALASVASKYIRELSMIAFNQFWQKHIPELKPTAGYPVDAIRFRQDIQCKQQELDIPMIQLWRNR